MSVDLKKKGLEASTERFDHIDDHFMGRGVPKQSIKEWIPVDSGKPKGDVADPPGFGELDPGEEDEGYKNDHTSDTSDSIDRPGESSRTAINLEIQNPHIKYQRFFKSEGDESSRPVKKAERVAAFEKVVYCVRSW